MESKRKYGVNEKQVEKVCREVGIKAPPVRRRGAGGALASQKLTRCWLILSECS